VNVSDLDHVIVHVDDWDAAHGFYVGVLGHERVDNPEGAGNPLGAWAYRVGEQQINVHGPWPGQPGPCCPPPLNTVGSADLAFRTPLSPTECIELLTVHQIAIVAGPTERFGARGWGTSVYCHDPSGNGIELISYATE
jgi:catechol 2,3-dioxygenase-like lactoylglutathione lyase family enzyme